ncbi:vegetative cell wall protein gp1-like [Leguminivora glycinivorella]|uniref:vegetative cell wall protein gp1-like n=1 Tax=Leguminivora glycinivorella TaxID=1035111 RepID=UPI0020108BA6|nr:vegetative cell wall protein gp1-like [Leguminivora glycinivorella]
MSQSRNRRPSKPRDAREPARKASEYVTNNGKNTKENGGNKDTGKVPRTVRYELENALLGLCDVWFEEIKPHLVKNNVKLHTGGALNEHGYDLEPAREPRDRAQIDPGAASDTRRRPATSSRAYLQTRPAASRAPCPKPPLRTSPASPTNLRKLPQPPDDKKTQPAVRRPTTIEHLHTPAKSFPRNVHESSKQWKQPPVQKAPLQRSPAPPVTKTSKNYQRTIPSPPKGNQHTPRDQRRAPPPPKQSYQLNIRVAPKQEAPVQRPRPSAKTCQRTYYSPERPERDSDYMLENVWTRPTGRRALMPSRSSSPPPSPSPSLSNSLSTVIFFRKNVPSNDKKNTSSNRKKRKIPRTRRTKLNPPQSVPPAKRLARPCCTACALRIARAAQDAPPCPPPVPKHSVCMQPSSNKTANFSRWPAPKPKGSHTVSTRDCGVLTDLAFCTTSFSPAGDAKSKGPSRNSAYDHGGEATSRSRFMRSPFSLHGARLLPSPRHAQCLAPPEHHIGKPRGSQPVSTNLSPVPSSDETWFLRVLKEYTSHENQTAPMREHTMPCHDSKSSKQTIPIHNENKLLLENSPLFSKELVDLIADRNDERLRVLYENPMLKDSPPSVLCLAGTQKKRKKPTPKKRPWR